MCYLEEMKMGDLVYLILPCLMEGAYTTLTTELDKHRDLFSAEVFAKQVPLLVEHICKFSRDFWNVSEENNSGSSSGNSSSSKSAAATKWKYVVHEMRQLENAATRIKSLCEKLNVTGSTIDDQGRRLVRGLMSGGPTEVPGGPTNEKCKEILQLFSQGHEAEGDVVSEMQLNERN